MISDELVKLNVGGERFSIGLSHLRRLGDSPLATCVNARWRNGTKANEPIFFDRDPEFFSDILDFLEKGSCSIPSKLVEVKRLLQEAEFYQLDDLIEYVKKRDRMNRRDGGPFFPRDRVIWKSDDLEELLKKDLGMDIEDEESLPLGFRSFTIFSPPIVCPLCQTSTETLNGLQKNVLEHRRVTSGVAEVKEVYGDCCCVDLTFGKSRFIFHVPTKMLKQTDQYYK